MKTASDDKKMRYDAMTIGEVLQNITQMRFVLPGIQRRYEWSPEQIERLFDSLMREYPINSFMLWRVKDRKILQQYRFYQFLRDYERDVILNNNLIDGLSNGDFWAVVDGQQRMTSLYIGLIGTYTYDKSRRSEPRPVERRLYLNLRVGEEIEQKSEDRKAYDFRFWSREELEASEDKEKWFLVGDIRKAGSEEEAEELVPPSLADDVEARETLRTLWQRIYQDEVINYCELQEQDRTKILNIFIRTNRGGEQLSYSDLLMSMIAEGWKEDIRTEMDEIRRDIREFGKPGFRVSPDFVLKTMLTLAGGEVRFDLKNFSDEIISEIESKWHEMKRAILAAFRLLEQLGFNDSLLRAKNAVIPIIYYIYVNTNVADRITKPIYYQESKRRISKWLTLCLLKGIFGGHPDNLLKDMRTIIKENCGGDFPFEEIREFYKNDFVKNYRLDDDMINGLLQAQYGTAKADLVLFLLYPQVVVEHGVEVARDHMHPKVYFLDKEKFKALALEGEALKYAQDPKYYNSVLNLQLLDQTTNESKKEKTLAKWVEDYGKTGHELYLGAKAGQELQELVKIEKFNEFIDGRQKELAAALKKIA